MTVGDLIEHLINLSQDTEACPQGADTEVRFAHQPQWAFEYAIGEVVSVNIAVDGEEDAELTEDERRWGAGDEPHVIYIAEGEQLGYLPGAAAEALGWGR